MVLSHLGCQTKACLRISEGEMCFPRLVVICVVSNIFVDKWVGQDFVKICRDKVAGFYSHVNVASKLMKISSEPLIESWTLSRWKEGKRKKEKIKIFIERVVLVSRGFVWWSPILSAIGFSPLSKNSGDITFLIAVDWVIKCYDLFIDCKI